jgi:KipI family sensor histidine kinase inhibitor
MTETVRYDLGDAAMIWTWPGGISLETSRDVLKTYRIWHDDLQLRRVGVLDVVPTYSSIAIHFDPAGADIPGILERVRELMQARNEEAGVETTSAPATEAAPVILPVTYNGADLQRVAELNGLDIQQVVTLHSGATYTVGMIGFRPHFPYLIGMPEELATPRLGSPRKRVPAGSVGIAGHQTGVYPLDSPGGWNIIGTTDPELLVSLRPGDTVCFSREGQ